MDTQLSLPNQYSRSDRKGQLGRTLKRTKDWLHNPDPVKRPSERELIDRL